MKLESAPKALLWTFDPAWAWFEKLFRGLVLLEVVIRVIAGGVVIVLFIIIVIAVTIAIVIISLRQWTCSLSLAHGDWK